MAGAPSRRLPFVPLTCLLRSIAAEIDGTLLDLVLTYVCHVANGSTQLLPPLVPAFLDVSTAVALWAALAFTVLGGPAALRVPRTRCSSSPISSSPSSQDRLGQAPTSVFFGQVNPLFQNPKIL
jgi:hypothetical protein